MNNKRDDYISHRVTGMFFILITFILVLLIMGIISSISEGRYLLFFISAYLVLGIILYICYKWIYQPYKKNTKVFKLFISGYTIQGIFDQQLHLNPESEEVIKKFKEIMNTNELINATKKQSEYLALQNQINPHFLYNTLEGIRGETLNAGLENVAKMTEALATFFRYTISNVENLVTLEDELSNIYNYYIIQQYRFGERVNLSIEYDSEIEAEILRCRLPKLTLQPIVENAIYHGIERKVGKGHLRVKIEATSSRLIITISDDGIGMAEERLAEINNKLNSSSFEHIKADSEVRGGIAVVNVNNRIRLLFGEEFGIYIYSTLNVGTDVEITLPLINKDIEGN